MTMTRTAPLVRRWVELYTRGLAAELRDARRAEIESDLWAQAEEAENVGRGSSSVEVEMLTRLALGMPADIGWRRSHRRGSVAANRKEIALREPRSHQVLTVIGVALTALDLVLAALGLVNIQGDSDPADVLVASAKAVAMMSGLALALVGLLFVSRSPAAGRKMVIAGSAVAGGMFLILLPWMWIAGLPLILPIFVIGVVRARQVTEAQHTLSA
jgi:hypothetical protein